MWLVGVLVALVIWSNGRRVYLRARWRREASLGGPPEPPRDSSRLPPLLMSLGYTALLVGAWTWTGRPWSWLGFTWNTGVAAALAAACGAGYLLLLGGLLVSGVRAARHDGEELAAFRALARRLRDSQFKVSLSPAVVIIVGAWEELCFRGYLYWLLTERFGVPFGFVLCSVAFGVSHASQGPRVLGVTTGLGAAFTALRLFSGSVLLPAIVHAAHNAIVAWCVTTVERIPDRGEASAAEDGAPPTASTEVAE